MIQKKTKNNPVLGRNYSQLAPILMNEGVGVLRTDTIYGLVGSALDKKTVNRIYKIRKRDRNKPMIILISSFDDLKIFGVKMDAGLIKTLNKYWPGKTSIILPCDNKKFQYLHRGKKTMAFRWPDKKKLTELIKKSGPLVAPSANISGKEPARDIKEAKSYFGNNIDFYIDEGSRISQASTLISLIGGKIKILRKGSNK